MPRPRYGRWRLEWCCPGCSAAVAVQYVDSPKVCPIPLSVFDGPLADHLVLQHGRRDLLEILAALIGRAVLAGRVVKQTGRFFVEPDTSNRWLVLDRDGEVDPVVLYGEGTATEIAEEMEAEHGG